MDSQGRPTRISRRTGVLLALSLLAPLSLYAVLATRMLRAGVGYEMDEALYVESAVFLLHGQGTPPFVHDPASWVTVFGRRLPLMIIPYVGAAKAYAALPLFAAFGAAPRPPGSPAFSSAASESPASSRSSGRRWGPESR